MTTSKPWDKIPDSPAQQAMRQAVKSETPRTDVVMSYFPSENGENPANIKAAFELTRQLERELTSQLHTSETLRIANGVLAERIEKLEAGINRILLIYDPAFQSPEELMKNPPESVVQILQKTISK